MFTASGAVDALGVCKTDLPCIICGCGWDAALPCGTTTTSTLTGSSRSGLQVWNLKSSRNRLNHPAQEDTATVYMRYAKPYGLALSQDEILARYRRSYATPWAASSIRYVDDGKPFWRFIVSESTGINDERMFTSIYDYYSRPEAWTVAPGAREALRAVREELGIKTAVVSNFDRRLHDILGELELTELFDAVVVSADKGVEKPNPVLFQAACDALVVRPEHVVHVGDDRRNDVNGARDAGCYAWLMGDDVKSFADVLERIRTGNLIDSLSDPA